MKKRYEITFVRIVDESFTVTVEADDSYEAVDIAARASEDVGFEPEEWEENGVDPQADITWNGMHRECGEWNIGSVLERGHEPRTTCSRQRVQDIWYDLRRASGA